MQQSINVNNLSFQFIDMNTYFFVHMYDTKAYRNDVCEVEMDIYTGSLLNNKKVSVEVFVEKSLPCRP